MPGSMAPIKKLRNTTELPLALNPLKSKDVLAVLAERNQAIVPVGAWVEPAPPDSSAVPASTSAYMIEEELREQLRKKQEALKRFQRQVKRRVNQQIRLRKKQQLQRSYEAAEKEGSIAMHSSDPANLTLKRTSVFPNHLNAAIGSARLPPSRKLEDGIEDRENQNELFQQQAQALSQTMKEARHRLASFKTVNKKNASVFPDDQKKNFPTQEKGKKNLSWGDQQDLLFEDKDIPFSTVQKVQFKNPLFAVMEEEEVKQLHQDVLPEAQDYLPEAPGDLLQTQGDLTGVCSVELEAQGVELRLGTQDIKLEGQAVEPKAQAVKTKTQSVMLKDQSVELEDGNIVLEVQDFLLQNQAFLPTDQHILPKDQNVLPKCQDQDFLPTDQTTCFLFLLFLLNMFLKQLSSFMREERERDELTLGCHQNVKPKMQDQASPREQVEQNAVRVGGEYQSGLNTEFQTPLALQSGVSQEEDKKERQKQYLRYRRLFMDIEREQVKEQQRQKEQRKKIEKIKKKKEQQRYAEEQRILRMNFHEEPYSGEKMSEILAQLQLEEGAREKQQKEKEHQRYVEALRAQIQEKMQLYNITLPPLCCCGPDFWDAHPDTCANNCIFYKNHKAYTRALHSVINSCDIPEGNSTLRVAIHNFASAHRRTLKNL
uniref:Coiled-coil domain containing 15 n=1 Tax=Monodon monoceros TaxID=40151 RepID=A0A8C6BZV4_MONMO